AKIQIHTTENIFRIKFIVVEFLIWVGNCDSIPPTGIEEWYKTRIWGFSKKPRLIIGSRSHLRDSTVFISNLFRDGCFEVAPVGKLDIVVEFYQGDVEVRISLNNCANVKLRTSSRMI